MSRLNQTKVLPGKEKIEQFWVKVFSSFFKLTNWLIFYMTKIGITNGQVNLFVCLFGMPDSTAAI
jgi:hypothetical protein